MKKFTKQALAIVAIAAFAVTGCKKGSEGSFNRQTGAGGPFNGADSVITGNITGRTLSPGKVYKLDGIVFVTSGTLTIQPGTVITTGAAKSYKVDPSAVSNSIAGVLVITKTAKIHAVGLPDQPIVFTSPKASGARAAGDFGGVIVLGQGLTNKPANTVIEGLPTFDGDGNSLGVDITYGGNVETDNSGAIQYVRIEYAGFRLAQDNEINGLTLGGVKKGTLLDHVQVSFGADDAFEFFGGNVDAEYLVAVANDDDDFDTDFGYSGTIQYAISLKDPNSTHSTTALGAFDSNGIESDNDNVNNNVATPKTKPTYLNFTILGYSTSPTNLSVGNRWRRNTDLEISNSIIAGYNTGVEFLNGTLTNATTGGFHDNTVHAFNSSTVFNNTNAVSLSGTLASNTVPTSAAQFSDPISFIGLGLSNNNVELNPFYTTALSNSYSIDNLYPRSANSTRGAVTADNYSNWTGSWLNFTPQTSVD